MAKLIHLYTKLRQSQDRQGFGQARDAAERARSRHMAQAPRPTTTFVLSIITSSFSSLNLLL